MCVCVCGGDDGGRAVLVGVIAHVRNGAPCDLADARRRRSDTWRPRWVLTPTGGLSVGFMDPIEAWWDRWS